MSTEKPHYLGHRQRLKERYAQAGVDGLSSYELIELMLFLAIPRGDVKPLAKELSAKYPDLPTLLNADAHDLQKIKGVGEGVVHLLRLFRDVGLKLLQQKIVHKPVLSNWNEVLDYCMAAMSHLKIEQTRLLFLDRKNQLLGDEIQQTGTVNHTPLYPREVVKRALDLGASAIILVHNHPTGDPTPSQADIDVTRQLYLAGKPLGIQLHDHVIIGKGEHVSLKSMGLF